MRGEKDEMLARKAQANRRGADRQPAANEAYAASQPACPTCTVAANVTLTW